MFVPSPAGSPCFCCAGVAARLSAQTPYPRSFTDGKGHKVALAARPARIASVVLGGDENLMDLVDSSRIVAMTEIAKMTDVSNIADRIPAILQQQLAPAAIIRSLSLQSHGLTGRPMYIVGVEGMEGPVVVDAQTGLRVQALGAEEARAIAERDFTGSEPVESVETITRPYQKGYDYFGELPVHRVNFANWKGTRIYVSPSTGEIRLRRNVDKTFFDSGVTLFVPSIKRKLGRQRGWGAGQMISCAAETTMRAPVLEILVEDLSPTLG